ncbi:MAG: cytoplasmic protein [Byssovorax sp.]
MSSAKFNFPPKLAPTGIADVDLVNAHTHSINHREALFRSERCGCFNCLAIFPPGDIEDWTDEVEGVNVTAICPKCGIDTVIGSASGYPIEEWFLRRMQDHWCRDED